MPVWQRLLDIQRRIAPEAIDELLKRFELLKRIEANQPIGRRTLAKKLDLTERVLRKEVDRLQSLGLILIDKRGIAISQAGIDVMEELSPYITTIDRRADLARGLKEKFGLKGFFIVRGDADGNPELQKELSKRMAEELQKMFFDGTVISVAGGSTMANVGNYLKPTDGKLLFVPARGGLGEEVSNQANSIASRLAVATKSEHKVLYAPDNVGESVLESLKLEPAVKEVAELNRKSDYVIHGIGEAFMMAERRNVGPDVIEQLQEKGAVGETFGYYFNAEGDILRKVKTIGLQLEDLESKQAIFAVAGGSSKKEAVRAYMKIAPKNTLLFIDETIAEYLLNS
ncbi:sugar-binding transcriptional regulator [Salinicoccus sp. HZC-1]|uniref:sugar-binding transcriptional regulator n=1 Tax=Salinicoccus sp. HZC-1 TaxID=3385497 RepID=UPI00398BA9C8